MPKFIHAYELDQRPAPPVVEYPETRDIVKADVDKDGHEIFVVVDQENFYKKIQAQKDGCDLEQIIRRYLMGDVSVLQRAQGFYADARDWPKSRQEALNLAFEVERAYNNLPEEERAQYADLFDFAMGKGREAKNAIAADPAQPQTEEVKADAGAT